MSQNFYNKDDDNVIDIDVEKLKKRTGTIIPLILLVIIAAVLLTGSFYTLDTSENGVILRLGKVSHVVEQAGLHFKVPVIDQVRKVNVETVYNMEYGFRTQQRGSEYSEPIYQDVSEEANVIVDGASGDASIALIELIIQYKVEDPVNYLFKVDDVEGTLRLALEDVVRTSVQAFTLAEAKTQKEAIDAVIFPALQKKISSYNTGLEIVLVGTQNVQFLPSVEEAFQARENANQYRNGKLEDGERYQKTVFQEAEAAATVIVEEANGYAATVKADAKADVAQFLALYEEYKNKPDILSERYYLDAMSTFLTNNKIVMNLAADSDVYKFYNLDDSAIRQSVVE